MNSPLSKPPKRSKFLLFFGGIWLIVGLPFVLMGIHFVKLEKRFEQEGVTVTGQVLGKTMEEHRDSDKKGTTKSYYANYKFTTKDGATIESKSSIGKEAWETIKEGADIQIQYLPGEQDQNRVAGESGIWGGVLLCLFGLLSAAIGAVSIGIDVKKRIFIKRLFEEGELAGAEVTSVRPGNLTINKVPQWRVSYTFKDRLGKEVQGISEHMNPEEAMKWKTGDTGKVRYDKSNPLKNIWIGNET